MVELQPLFMTLLGGLLVTLGSVLTIRQQAELARRVRMEERFAEKKIEVNGQAYKKAKVIQSMLIQQGIEATLKQMQAEEGWLFEQRLFLPGRFPEKWLGVCGCLTQAAVLQQNLEDRDKPEVLALWRKARELIEDAIREIYKDMKLNPMEIELLDGSVRELSG